MRGPSCGLLSGPVFEGVFLVGKRLTLRFEGHDENKKRQGEDVGMSGWKWS